MIGQDRSRCDESFDIISSLLLCVGSTPFRILECKVTKWFHHVRQVGRTKLKVFNSTTCSSRKRDSESIRSYEAKNNISFEILLNDTLSSQIAPFPLFISSCKRNRVFEAIRSYQPRIDISSETLLNNTLLISFKSSVLKSLQLVIAENIIFKQFAAMKLRSTFISDLAQ